MAKQYYAINTIRHGMGTNADGSPNEKVFEQDQQVTGLPKEVMVRLWEAGVLREVDPDARPADDRDVHIQELQAEIERLKAAQADADAAQEAAERDPNDVPGLGEDPTPTSAEAAADLQGTVADPPKPEAEA